MNSDKTMANDAPAHQQDQNSTKDNIRYCKYCQGAFKAKTNWQAFCVPEHKKLFEKVMSELIADVRQPLYRAAEKLSAARQS